MNQNLSKEADLVQVVEKVKRYSLQKVRSYEINQEEKNLFDNLAENFACNADSQQ